MSAVEGHLPPSRGSRRLSGGEIGISNTNALGGSGAGSMASVGKTPPATPRKVGGKMLAVKVLMLDDTYTLFQIQNKALGALLLEQACRQLNLLESDYFGLEYTDGNTRYWLDLDKPLNRQVCLSQFEPVLRFCVKFYTPDPSQLEEEYTRYLFALQIKRDLSHGDLICNENTAAIMAAYVVQAECGDFVDEDYPDHRYLTLFRFTPNQDDLMERRIMENHRKHIGMTPAAADLNLLETARRCELFGIKMHSAKDHENVVLNLSVAHMGIVVFQCNTKINTFSWAKIRKISFKRKRFLIKLHPEGYGYYKDVVEFFFDGRNECKNFWKKCVEHHGFFRCSIIKKIARQKTRVLSKGSSFRYSGRTQKQVQEFVRENFIKRQPFQRSQSFRHSPSVHPGGMSGVGMSISAQPLVPLRDNQCVGTPVSLSCGSMTLPSTAEPPSPISHVDKDYKEFHEESPSVMSGGHDPYGYNQRNNMEYTLSPATATPTLSQSPNRLMGTPTPFTQTAQQKGRPNGTPQQSHSSKEDISHKNQHPSAPSPVSTIGSQSPTSIQTISTPKPGSVDPHILVPLSPISPDISTSNKLDYMDFQNHISNNESIVQNGRSEIAPLRLSKDSETKKRRHPGDRSYFIVKEMLTTERTYKKDLEVIIIWFREEVKKEEGMPNEVLHQLFGSIEPIYEFHSKFVKELDNRLAQWDGTGAGPNRVDSQRMGDLMMKVVGAIEMYQNYFSQHLSMLENLEGTFHKNKKFEQIYRDFDLQKVCYLPFTVFLLKPMHRLPHYHLLLERLLHQYGSQGHPDYMECMAAKAQLDRCVDALEPLLSKSENFVKLVELQRDLVGIDNLVQPGREFIREGCLQKLSRKGYQQRMFFLFNDVLLYTNRTTTPILQFKVHGQLPLRGVMVEENECRMGATNCFTIYGGNRALMVAANSEEDKSRWLEDLSLTINDARDSKDEAFHYLSLKSISCSDEVLDKSDLNSSDETNSRTDKMGPQTRSNTTVHVCWHRATSVAKKDYINAVHNQLSGYLLRKFKNSMGWQKLWVVFTNFCLFFYKTFQDDSPLASLPLLGYTISSPGEEDQIQKEYVFKLQFKNHVYFFRAESEYTFSRWMEVIGSATKGSARNRLFSRMESNNIEELQE